MGNAILVGEQVGETFSYLSQENRNEFKKYSHHTTGLGSHVLLTSEGKLRNPVGSPLSILTNRGLMDRIFVKGSQKRINNLDAIHTNGGMITG